MCSEGHCLLEGMSSTSPVVLEDLIFCWLLLGPLPEFPVADHFRSMDLKDSSRAGVDESLT